VAVAVAGQATIGPGQFEAIEPNLLFGNTPIVI